MAVTRAFRGKRTFRPHRLARHGAVHCRDTEHFSRAPRLPLLHDNGPLHPQIPVDATEVLEDPRRLEGQGVGDAGAREGPDGARVEHLGRVEDGGRPAGLKMTGFRMSCTVPSGCRSGRKRSGGGGVGTKVTLWKNRDSQIMVSPVWMVTSLGTNSESCTRPSLMSTRLFPARIRHSLVLLGPGSLRPCRPGPGLFQPGL